MKGYLVTPRVFICLRHLSVDKKILVEGTAIENKKKREEPFEYEVRNI